MSDNDSTTSVKIKEPQIDLAYYLALWHIPDIRPVHFKLLLNYFSPLSELFKESENSLTALGLSDTIIKKIKNPDWELVEKDLRWQENINHHILYLSHPNYPLLLKEINEPPPILFVKGYINFLQQSQLAIVGSRKPTIIGKEIAHDFAEQLAQHELIITSGLALGIDAASHQGALAVRKPTIAVLGSGIERIYPSAHMKLAEQIIQHGALISEFPLDMPPLSHNFPQRNRTVSGLSLGTLIVEADIQSGSLITARFALEQNREVFAIPGSIHNPMAKGCHALIKRGAKLVENIEDILEEIKGQISLFTISAEQKNRKNKQNLLEGHNNMLLECIGYEITPMEQIIVRSGMSAQLVMIGLSKLELEGYISASPGGYVRLSK